MSDLTKKSFTAVDVSELDQKIPQNLMMIMNGKPFVLKAGLEWKANQLFGFGKWSLKTEIIENDRENHYVLVKATVLFQDQAFENFGEASKENVSNPAMHKYMLHMAVTRAEARALRVATACGFTAVEELGEEKNMAQASVIDNTESRDLDRCEECDRPITQKVRSYSTSVFKKPLCMSCQQEVGHAEGEQTELPSETIAAVN